MVFPFLRYFISLFALKYVNVLSKFINRFALLLLLLLLLLATSPKAVNESTIYADIQGFLSPSIITGENLRPDLLLRTNNNYLYILELTVGFESNLETNATRKHSNYAPLLSGLQRQFKCVSFVNLSMSSLGIFGNSCNSFFKMCDSLSID